MKSLSERFFPSWLTAYQNPLYFKELERLKPKTSFSISIVVVIFHSWCE